MLGIYTWIRNCILSCLLLGIIALGALIVWAEGQLPSINVLKDARLQIPLRVYSSDGQLLAEYGEKRRIPVTLAAVPPLLIQAILATEDQRFYTHSGVDLRGLARAAIALLASGGGKEQGGSTITMQLARNFFLSRQKSFWRKFNEILLAMKIEKTLTKNEILELYVNKIYLGKRAYGVAAAAEVYYGKNVQDLSLAQMAMLAGLPQAPSAINPLHDAEAAYKRRTHVLNRMLTQGLIKQDAYNSAMQETIKTTYHGRRIDVYAPYIGEMVRRKLVDEFGEDAYEQGYKVITTVIADQQAAANLSLQRSVREYYSRHKRAPADLSGALVALEAKTGAIMALTGGVDYEKHLFNCAVQAERQPGSSFKPFIYAAAFEAGFTPASVINDAPFVYDLGLKTEWRPQNHTKEFYGPTSLRVAILKSQNLVSVKLLATIGLEKALNFLQQVGFEAASLPKGLSLALGSNSLTPLTLASRYAMFANGGNKIEPYFIEKILDAKERVVYTHTPVAPVPVIQPQTAYLITSLLQDAIRRGSGRPALVLKRQDLAGKTGTTNGYHDVWYAGYNRNLVVVTWMGYHELHSLKEYSQKTALPMWIYFWEQLKAHLPEAPVPRPAGIVSARIDPLTGLLAHPEQEDALYEVFNANSVPKEFAPLRHGKHRRQDDSNTADDEDIGEDLF
jgi:penicillin-binding protein 1A